MSSADRPAARLLDAPEQDAARAKAARALITATQALGDSAATGRIDADAVMLRGLLAGATAQDAALLKSVWGRVQVRHGAPISVWGGLAFTLVADRFGLGARSAAEPEQALAAAEGGGRAILDIGGGRPWWGRLLARPELRIVMALPDDARSLPRVLMVSKEPSGPSGDDRTFWTTDSTAPDARIIAKLSEAGLAASPLAAAGGLRLFMLMGYVQPDDPRLSDAPGDLNGVLGSAPVL